MSDFEKGARAMRDLAAREASAFSMKIDRSLHPDVPWEQMAPGVQTAAHSTAQSIAMDIRALPIPATPAGELSREASAMREGDLEMALLQLLVAITTDTTLVPDAVVMARALVPVVCEHCPDYPHPLNDDETPCKGPVPAASKGTP